MKDQIEAIVSPLLAKYPRMDLVVGLLKQDQHSILGFGGSSSASSQSPKGESIFEIGSLTKLFTATLLARLVQDQRVSLDTPLRAILTEYPNLPESITLLQLATHTSGLPRLPTNIHWSLMRSPRNPYAHYTVRSLHNYLKHYKRAQGSPPSFPYAYSNLGAGLLGYALARKLNTTYEQAIQKYICGPLNLRNTGITLTPAQQAHLITPHNERGKPTPLWDMGPLAGAGGLRSNAEDMLTFLGAQLDQSSGPLASILPLCHRIYVEKPSPRLSGIALGWHVGPLENTAWQAYRHTGATYGCMAFIGFIKACNAGIIVLSNHGAGSSGGTDIAKYCMNILHLLCTQ